MQVEYENPANIMPPPPTSLRVLPLAGEEASDVDDEEEEDEPLEEQAAAPKEKTKRVIKQRQSLAEKERGTTIFPISRIKRIIKADKELDMMSNEACFMVAVATEYFIKHFMEEGYTKARLDKRRIVNYKDMAAVVARSEEFDFLRDVVPAPIPMSEALERRKQKMAQDDNPTLHEDDPAHDLPPSDDLPTLIPSTNPLFPNAVVKKPPNTHAKSASGKGKAKDKDGQVPGPCTPRLVTGKNAPSTPHSLTTRHSARKSTAASDADEVTGQNNAAIPHEGRPETGIDIQPGPDAISDKRDSEVMPSSAGPEPGDDRMEQD